MDLASIVKSPLHQFAWHSEAEGMFMAHFKSISEGCPSGHMRK